MISWRDFLYRIGHQTENHIDELKIRFRERMGWETAVHICPYISFGNEQSLYVKGRVLHDRGIETESDDSFWDNLTNMYYRVNSHEIKGAKMRLTYYDLIHDFYSDEDGYFGEIIPMPSAIDVKSGWHTPVIEMLESPLPFKKPLRSVAKILVPPASVTYGVISDIDDTILKTDATSLLKMAWNTFAKNARSRIAFKGVAAFYRALHKGKSGNNKNPFFYVSSSPWNLYDVLIDFINLHGIPEGPLFLKDYGFTHNKIITEGHEGHKPKKIKKILNAYPEMKFILIGDSGQKDPEIYSNIIKEFPDRILAVYIRDVTIDERDVQVKKIYNSDKPEMVYSENSLTAAIHAAKHGWIEDGMLAE